VAAVGRRGNTLCQGAEGLLDQPALAAYILARTEGTIGEITMFLTRAAIAAIDSSEEALTRKTLMLAEYASPSERRSTFEREIR